MLHLLFLFSEESFLQSLLIWCRICYVTFVVFVFRGILPSVFAHLVLYMLCYICCFCFQRKPSCNGQPSCSLCSSGVVYVMLNLLFLFPEEAFLRCPAYLQSMLIWCCICYVTFVVFVFRGSLLAMSSLPAVYAHLSPGHRTEQGRPTRGHQPITGKTSVSFHLARR